MAIKLIVGLGNYPQQYQCTRHNIGFMVIDSLCAKLNTSLGQTQFNGKITKITVGEHTYILAQPLTYMNLSGDFVSAIANYYHIDIINILIISDDIYLPIGGIRYRINGSAGGHNGIKDIIDKLHSQNIARIRIGIGQPANPSEDLANYVIGRFGEQEIPIIQKAIVRVVDILFGYIRGESIKL
ncbi:MAG: aminoacyl-tRNA hydrolase [Mycoplasmataceae bacterium]|jgi:PTH1 family peptidyl-tRNA hydrolase|nr:aminoacyl-tRNA hydrolase [Mycoplasmataceae bacterium]